MNSIKLLIYVWITDQWRKKIRKQCEKQKGCKSCNQFLPETRECKTMKEIDRRKKIITELKAKTKYFT